MSKWYPLLPNYCLSLGCCSVVDSSTNPQPTHNSTEGDNYNTPVIRFNNAGIPDSGYIGMPISDVYFMEFINYKGDSVYSEETGNSNIVVNVRLEILGDIYTNNYAIKNSKGDLLLSPYPGGSVVLHNDMVVVGTARIDIEDYYSYSDANFTNINRSTKINTNSNYYNISIRNDSIYLPDVEGTLRKINNILPSPSLDAPSKESLLTEVACVAYIDTINPIFMSEVSTSSSILLERTRMGVTVGEWWIYVSGLHPDTEISIEGGFMHGATEDTPILPPMVGTAYVVTHPVMIRVREFNNIVHCNICSSDFLSNLSFIYSDFIMPLQVQSGDNLLGGMYISNDTHTGDILLSVSGPEISHQIQYILIQDID